VFYIIKFLESLVFPPGIFIVLLLAIGIISFQRHHTFASAILIVALLLYVASTSVVAYALIRPLETAYTPPKHPVGDVLVMLGGGATYGTPDVAGLGNLTGDGANRLLTTAMLYQKTKLPIVLTSGPMHGATSQSLIAKGQLVALGVPADAIITENNSLNTLQNAQFTKPILAKEGFTHPILITSAYHMRRAVLDFKHAGVQVTPYPCGYYTNSGEPASYNRLFPSVASLSITELSLHEYLGILAAHLGLQG
jgi:uncharacterized SAM-binding protein YcdF (DUF218 family)